MTIVFLKIIFFSSSVVALMYACIFGNMVAIVQRLYSKASSFHTHMNTVREFLKFYKIPEELRASINNYVRREWNVSQGVDVDAVSASLFKFRVCSLLTRHFRVLFLLAFY